jgi:ribosomal protein S18 acetylase RimI-like enzyme
MITVREATANDKTSVARVHVRSWQVAYRGLIADEYLDQMKVEDRAARYTFETGDASSPTTIVAIDGGSLLGFATFGPSPDVDVSEMGELFALYVDPDSWRRGIGTTLITEARSHLRDMVFTKAILWVLEGNDLAVRFYESHGWLPDGLRRQHVVWGVTVNELRFAQSLIY